jgi:succinyl-CoA synthetase beta subunit
LAFLRGQVGGIEAVARERPEAVRRITVSPLLPEIPPFALRDLLGELAKEVSPVANRLYRIFREKDAILAEINPLVTTPKGICAADAKIIVDESALARQKLPKGFQHSEFLLEHGMLDAIVDRREMRDYLINWLHFFIA